MFKRTILFGAALFALAGCQKEQATSPSSSSPLSKGLSTQASAPILSPAISVDPDTVQTCDGISATIHWDASKSGVGTGSTEVWVSSPNSETKLFAAGGASGNAKTDAWTRPGTEFLLKNKLDGKVIGKAVVGGPACR
jgi:hypothetical protein